jgi:hypothetical protein
MKSSCHFLFNHHGTSGFNYKVSWILNYTLWTALHFALVSQSILNQSYVTTDGQSANLSWCQAPICCLRPDFDYVKQLRVRWCGVLSLMGERVCRLQFLVFASAAILGSVYRLGFQTPLTWRDRSLYLYPPGTGWPSYTPRHWVPFGLSLVLLTECVYFCAVLVHFLSLIYLPGFSFSSNM